MSRSTYGNWVGNTVFGNPQRVRPSEFYAAYLALRLCAFAVDPSYLAQVSARPPSIE
jgi:hypothetical protein